MDPSLLPTFVMWKNRRINIPKICGFLFLSVVLFVLLFVFSETVYALPIVNLQALFSAQPFSFAISSFASVEWLDGIWIFRYDLWINEISNEKKIIRCVGLPIEKQNSMHKNLVQLYLLFMCVFCVSVRVCVFMI